MNQDSVCNKYFEWLYALVCGKRYSKLISYKKLLMFLHSTEFTHLIPNDQNRSADGVDLRYRFSTSEVREESSDFIADCLCGPCSVFEMMVALSLRCEESIMDDPQIGDRTGQWFWGMIVNLGLGCMNDNRFNKSLVTQALITFLNRDYEADGAGGLFTIKHSEVDLRTVEIWYQMCWYLDRLS